MLCRAVFIYIRYTTHLSYQISFFLVLAPTHVVSVNLVVQVREEGIKRWNENFFSCNKTIFGGSVFFPRPEKKKKDRQKKVTPKHTLARVLCVCVCACFPLFTKCQNSKSKQLKFFFTCIHHCFFSVIQITTRANPQ